MFNYNFFRNSWKFTIVGCISLLDITHTHVPGEYTCIYARLDTHNLFQQYVSLFKYVHFIRQRFGEVRRARISEVYKGPKLNEPGKLLERIIMLDHIKIFRIT